MPTVSVGRDKLFKALGATYTDEAFDELCFEFGIELDEITTEGTMMRKEKGEKGNAEKAAQEEEEVLYKIDVPANRYDLLCLEGLALALNVFRQKQAFPSLKVTTPSDKDILRMTVEEPTQAVRPFVVCAVLRGMTFTADSYASFIDLQEKLHQNICRRRTLVAIGTHDLDTLTPPFTYTARPPADIKFKPLNQTQEFTGPELMAHYRADNHLKHFLHIIENEPRYPVIVDAKGVVLSLPPIINGDHSKITLASKNVFFECTATDLHKANVVLNTMVTMFGGYSATPFTVEAVHVTPPASAKLPARNYPDLSSRVQVADVALIRSRIGLSEEQLPADDIAQLLTRMCLPAELSADKASVTVRVPPTRSDILHECDIMEDVAIGYGFNRIPYTVPQTNTVAQQLPVNALTDQLRDNLALAGFTECLNFALCSRDENFAYLRHQDDGTRATHIANPKTQEFQVVRTSLVPGVLKTMACNKGMPLPLKVFEVSDVVLKSETSDTGAANQRMLCAIVAGRTSQFEVVHGLLDRVMLLLQVPLLAEQDRDSGVDAASGRKGYWLRPSDNPTFFPGRQADVMYGGRVLSVGTLGVVHPEVLGNFNVDKPCALLEMNVQPFV